MSVGRHMVMDTGLPLKSLTCVSCIGLVLTMRQVESEQTCFVVRVVLHLHNLGEHSTAHRLSAYQETSAPARCTAVMLDTACASMY